MQLRVPSPQPIAPLIWFCLVANTAQHATPSAPICPHADLMYNVMSFRYDHASDPRFDLIPFAGCRLIHNSNLHRSDFSLNYGIQAKYHLTDRLHLTAEASGLTTFQQFDGVGA